jgi:hypothetical protein
MILKLARFARMVLSPTPMHLAFRPATAECFLTIDFVQVISVQLFQTGVQNE